MKTHEIKKYEELLGEEAFRIYERLMELATGEKGEKGKNIFNSPKAIKLINNGNAEEMIDLLNQFEFEERLFKSTYTMMLEYVNNNRIKYEVIKGQELLQTISKDLYNKVSDYIYHDFT